MRLTGFSDDRLVHLEPDEVDQQRSPVLAGEALLHADVDGSLHRLWLDLRLAPVDVKVDVELLVSLLQLLDRQVSESSPLGDRLGLAWTVNTVS